MLMLNVMIKNLCNSSNEKTQYSFILKQRCWERGVGERGLNKWNHGKSLKYIKMYVMLFWGHSLTIIK